MQHSEIKLKPIFIGGCDRSGTTMLGSMLGAHETCLATPESQFVIDIYKSYVMGADDPDLPVVIWLIKKHWRFKHVWKIDTKGVLNNQCYSYQDIIFSIIKEYGRSVGKSEISYWIDHTPSNIDNVAYLSELFPHSKFINIIRDGRAVTSSTMKRDWGRVTIEQNANYWIKKIAFGMGAQNFFGPKSILNVYYESMIEEPEEALRQICEFTGLKYKSEMILCQGFIPPKYTQNQHVLIGNKPDLRRISSWKKELCPREIELFEYFAGPLLTYLGYERIYNAPKAPNFFEKLMDVVKINFVGRGFNRLKRWRRKFIAKIT